MTTGVTPRLETLSPQEAQLTDSLLSEIIRYVRSHTAFRAWLAEILVLFVVFTLGRAAIAVWLRWDTPTVQWWTKWL